MLNFLKEEIFKILELKFGLPKTSALIGESRRFTGALYYYKLDSETQVLALIQFLRSQYGHDPDFDVEKIVYRNYDDRYDTSKKDFFIKYSDDEEYLSIKMCSLEAIHFRRSYGRKIVASLSSDIDPILEILIRKSDCGLLTRDRGGLHHFAFTRWVNKCVYNNSDVRDIIVQLLEVYASMNPIFKDVARSVDRDHYFLLPIYFHEMLTCHKPSDLIERVADRRLDINYNKFDLNYSYYITYIALFVDEKSRAVLKALPHDRILSFIQTRDLLEGPNIERFLTKYYEPFVQESTRATVQFMVQDYLRMCHDHQELPHLHNSYTALVRKHDEMAAQYKQLRLEEEFSRPLIAENSQFAILRMVFEPMLEEDFTWIHETKQLFDEGQNQHNCVFSYRSRIRADLCSIWHLNRHGKSYTIRFEKDHWDRISISEMRDKYNKPYLQEDYFFVQKCLSKANAMLQSDKQKRELEEVFGNIVEVDDY